MGSGARSIISGPFISLAMMVKDEEEFLSDALESAKPWVDEIVVVDTGSTDRTIEIAEAHGAKLSHFEWCNDFSAARNQTLRRCSGAWILVLDADERLRGDQPEALRAFLRGLPGGYPFHVATIDVVNTALSGQVLSTLASVRLIPNDPRLGYVARVHNVFCSLDPARQQIVSQHYAGLEILHLGYDPEVYRRRKKAERSLPLIEASVAENPGNLLHRYYLGREYVKLGRYAQAIKVLRDTVKRLSGSKEFDRDVLVDSYWHLVEAMRANGEPSGEILRLAQDALSAFSDSADLWYTTGLALADAKKPVEAAACLEQAIARIPTDRGNVSHVAGRAFVLHERLAELYAEVGKLAEAYDHLLRAIAQRPPDAAGWTETLNLAIGLGLDLGRGEVPDLVDALLEREDAPLDMVFVYAERDPAAFDALAARHPRLAEARGPRPEL